MLNSLRNKNLGSAIYSIFSILKIKEGFLLYIDEFYAMGGEEYFENGICLIEWGEMIESILPPDYIKITFQKNDENEE